MKTRGLLIIFLIVSLCGNLFFLTKLMTPKQEKNPYSYRMPGDNRESIVLKPEHREFLLREMRQFVNSISLITQGIESHNPDLIIKAGQQSGTSVTPPEELPEFLPQGFLQMGRPTHKLFDTMADSARVNYHPRTAQKQLRELMSRCVACHASYRIEPAWLHH